MAGTNPDIPTIEAGGAYIPELGLGTWQNTGRQCVETVESALEMGYRHIDTAQIYGNEAEVGKAIGRSAVDREEIFLTTKVWRSNLRYDDVIDSVEESLSKLGTDYVDLLLIHWPHPRHSLAETLDAMETLQDEGAVAHLGVANFTRDGLERAIDLAEAPIVTDQVLYHPWKDRSGLRSFCAENDVALTAYSPLARGGVIGDDLLTEIGDTHGKTAVQVALRWLLQQDGVIAIPKATSDEHLAANLDVFDFSLSDAEMARISDREPGIKRRLINLGPAIFRRNPL